MAGSRRNLYCRGSSVLQSSGVQGFKTVLQYSLLGSSVLQYTALYCGWKGCRRPGCIAIQPGVSWHETGSCVATRRWAGALGVWLGARGAQAGAGGALERRRQARARAGSDTVWARRGAQSAGGRWGTSGARRAQAGAAGRAGRAERRRALGDARGARQQALGTRPGRAGCALGVLGLFSIRF